MQKKLFILVLLAIIQLKGYSQQIPDLSAQQWKDDLKQLKSEYEAKHIKLNHFISKDVLEKKFSTLEKRIPLLKNYELMVELIKIGAAVGDGHTAVRPYEYFKNYPLTFFWFGNDLRIVSANDQNKELLGCKVIRMEKKTIKDAQRLIKELIPAKESPSFILSWSQALLRKAEILAALKISTEVDRVSITVEDQNGKRIKKTLFVDTIKGNLISAYSPSPLFMKQPEKSPWYEWLPDSKTTLYFNFENYLPGNQFRDFGMNFIKFINTNPVEKLVVDLRENGGGDFKKGLRLIDELKKTKLNEPGKIFVIIGRGTFSAGMSNAAHFKEMMNAALIGETSGGRPVGYQENHSFTLANSKIPASCSIKFYEFLKKDTNGIIPDVEILPDWNEYKNGNDPVIKWLLANVK